MEKESGRRNSMTNSVTCMRAATRWIKRMEWECSHGSRVIIIEGATRTMSDTVMEKCTGKTAHVTKVSGSEVFKTVSVRWNSQTVASRRASSRITHSRVRRSPLHNFKL